MWYFLYPLALISLSIYASRSKDVTIESYFFASRDTHWFTLGISILATSLFGPYILGLTPSGLSSGMTVSYAIVSIVMLVLLGGFFAPKFLAMKLVTIPEFFENRFGKNCRRFVSALYVLSNIALRLVIALTLGRILLSSIEGIDPFSSLLFFLVITGVYVMIGGLQAEIHAEVLQVALIFLGCVGFLAWSMSQGNSFGMMAQKVSHQVYFGNGNNFEYSGAGLILGLPIIGFWFLCADQFMVQKVVSVRNKSFAKKASLTAGVLQIVPLLFFVLPAIAFPLSWTTDSNGLLHTLFSSSSLPEGLRAGLITCSIAAFMIPIANVFTSTTSLITFDFFRSVKPKASDRQVVLVGRMTTVFLVIVSILLLFLSQSIDFVTSLQLFKIFSYFSAMVAAVFIVGLINKKIGGASALITLSAATFIILIRVILQGFFATHQFGEGVVGWFVQSAFLEFSVFVFLLSLALLIVSDFLKSRYESALHRTRHDPARVETFIPVFLAIVVIGVFLA